MPELKPRYNIAPTMEILAVLETEDSRIGSMMRWGIIPHWATGGKRFPVMNNARAETIAEKLTFRESFRQRRCLILASGFYKWKKEGKSKQPYFISSRDGAPFSFAGIWGTWTAGAGESIDSCAIVTTECNALMQPIHDRMPIILAPQAWEAWLDPDLKQGEEFGRRLGQRVKSDKLTPKVLALVAAGQSYRQIGRQLDLSKNTVPEIVKRERAKLTASNGLR